MSLTEQYEETLLKDNGRPETLIPSKRTLFAAALFAVGVAIAYWAAATMHEWQACPPHNEAVILRWLEEWAGGLVAAAGVGVQTRHRHYRPPIRLLLVVFVTIAVVGTAEMFANFYAVPDCSDFGGR